MGKYKKDIYKSSSFSSDYNYISVADVKKKELENAEKRLADMDNILPVREKNRLTLKVERLRKKLNVKPYIEKEEEKEENICNGCKKKFKSDEALTQHIKDVHTKTYSCNICNKSFPSEKALTQHINDAHKSKKYKEKKTTLANIEKIKDSEEQIPKDKVKSKSIDENASKSIKNDLLDAKRKHEGEIKEIEIELNPTVIEDIDAYIKKAQKEYEENLKNAPIKTTTHIVTRNVKVGRKETKWFLEKQYRGLCQICGFTFTKRKKGTGQYFELFDWFSEKITKQKVNVVQAGSSLSLCARCHSGVKYGSFKANLTDILKDIDISQLSFEDFVSKISISVDKKEIPECYDFIEMDMYKVNINLFNEEQVIFYTEEHFLHLYTMLRSGGE